MNDQVHVARAVTDSADEFQSIVQAVAGAIKITPKYKNRFRSSISVSRLHRIGMALIDIEPMHTLIEPQHDFYCLTVPIINSCHIKDAAIRREYSRNTAHLLYPERTLDSQHRSHCQLLGVTFMIDDLDDIARKLVGSTNALKPLNDCSLALTTPAGVNLVNQLSHICGQVYRDNKAPMSDSLGAELEDDLITALLLAMDENQPGTDDAPSGGVSKCQVALAADYLLNNLESPVTRTRLAEIAGVSVRSLSRAFVKRHGVGPMRFLRERRLEAVRMELINARPGSTKVSDIALRYGFSELGKFSLLYKSVYNEKPSETLRY
ncbi:MAG: helix-turn-helix domain-containing protein [Thiotrichales bacterium]|nr:MAG: helix-turn-helix domain-containing protein [Thiotrichales bacterium]